MRKIVHLVADYGNGDMAFSEVIQRIYDLYPRVTLVIPVSIPSFCTLTTGFVVAQIANGGGENTIIYHNCAPRKDNLSARVNNEGEPLARAVLQNGVEVYGVLSGFSFSFLKRNIGDFFILEGDRDGSQFRSRDTFPHIIFGNGIRQCRWHASSIEIIPDPPKNRIAYIDGYGNLKLTTLCSDVNFRVGDPVRIQIEEVTKEVIFSDGIFSINNGNLVLAPGSSGYDDDPFLEISLRGGHAALEFISDENIRNFLHTAGIYNPVSLFEKEVSFFL